HAWQQLAIRINPGSIELSGVRPTAGPPRCAILMLRSSNPQWPCHSRSLFWAADPLPDSPPTHRHLTPPGSAAVQAITNCKGVRTVVASLPRVVACATAAVKDVAP